MMCQNIERYPITETRETSVANLAMCLGRLIVSGLLAGPSVDCFIESVLMLARASGVSKADALKPFDHCQLTAELIWDALEQKEKDDGSKIKATE